MNENELYHHGVKGMKWGVRKDSYNKRLMRGHAGPNLGLYLTNERQLKADMRELDELNKGKHLSIGLTKKRQAAFDARDRKILEKRIVSALQKSLKDNKTDLDKPYRQPIGDGAYTVWPTKRKYIEAEITRLTRDSSNKK